jgi:hypothetical protein
LLGTGAKRKKLSLQSTSGGALVAVSHEKCLLGEMVRDCVRTARKQRYPAKSDVCKKYLASDEFFYSTGINKDAVSVIFNVDFQKEVYGSL